MSPHPIEVTDKSHLALVAQGLSDAPVAEATSDKLAREAQVLGGGALKGALSAAGKAAKHPTEALDELFISGMVGYGLTWAQQRAGVVGLGAEVVSMALAASAVKSTLEQPGWLGQVKDVWSDTWNSKAHSAENQNKAASLLGQATFDNALMVIGGGIGGKLGRSEYPRRLPYARETVSLPTTSRYNSMFSEVRSYDGKSDVAALYRARSASVVEVAREGQGTGPEAAASYASGVIVHQPDLVATSYHVAVKSDRLAVKTIDGRVVPATMIDFDRDHDLALLRASEPLGKPVVVPKEAKVNSDLAIMGYPSNGRRLHVSTGRGLRIEAQPSYLAHEQLQKQYFGMISSVFSDSPLPAKTGVAVSAGLENETVPMAVLTLPAIGGYSGSGVFRTADGQLLGILARAGNDNTAIATPVNRLFALINRLGPQA